MAGIPLRLDEKGLGEHKNGGPRQTKKRVCQAKAKATQKLNLYKSYNLFKTVA
jgi:hypothetical protein